MSLRAVRAALLLQAALLTGCAPLLAATRQATGSEAPVAHVPCATQAMHRLYFGLDSGGRELGETEWQNFVREVVVPRFPDGFTVMPAQGHWRGAAGQSLREAARVIEIVHPNQGAASVHVTEIAAHYKSRFRQESVLVVAFPVRACF